MVSFKAALATLVTACVLIEPSIAASASSDVKISAYVTDWALPSKIAWSKLDLIYYAFAIPDKSGSLGDFDANQLKTVVKEAHSNKKKVSLSVGGWSGSVHFSDLVKSSGSRQKFAKTLIKTVSEYNLDGIDIDWEYPNSPDGVACNSVDKDDTANFLSLMKLLRQDLGQHKLITAAVSTMPFYDSNQQPSAKLDPEWTKTVDFLNVMVYDLSGTWNSKTGANAALKNGGDQGSVEQAIQQWTSAGMSRDQLVVGVPFYGYLAAVDEKATGARAAVPFRSKTQIQGDKYDEKGADPCPGAKATFSGEYQYRSIVSEGVQHNKSDWTNFWDHATFTPYAYNTHQKTLLTYDNPASLKAKAEYVVQHKLGGLMIWSLEMDDANHSLLNSMQAVRK
ncbi:glycoside hydrolase superfamily, partial [Absidia repens]